MKPLEEYRRREFLHRRFEFYVNGRTCFFDGQIYAGGLLLAYAIEFHIKEALAVVEEDWTSRARKLVGSSHDLGALMHEARRHGLFTDLDVSDEFLDFASDQFQARYPSGAAKVAEDRGYWEWSKLKIYTYDDCIVQLDHAVSELEGSSTSSIFQVALATGRDSIGRKGAVFFGNIFANSLVPEEPEQNLPEAAYWKGHSGSPPIGFMQAKRLLGERLAGLFRYRSPDEPDPDPARVLYQSSQAETGLPLSSWVVDRLREHFGALAVDLERDRRRDEISAVVFSRSSSSFWRRLPLVKPAAQGLDVAWTRCEGTEAKLNRWIEDTERKFGRPG